MPLPAAKSSIKAELARALLSRITADINGSASRRSRATKSTSATGGNDDDRPTIPLTTSLTTVTPLNMGVVGDATLLTLYVSRVPNWAHASHGRIDQCGSTTIDFQRSEANQLLAFDSVGDGGLAEARLRSCHRRSERRSSSAGRAERREADHRHGSRRPCVSLFRRHDVAGHSETARSLVTDGRDAGRPAGGHPNPSRYPSTGREPTMRKLSLRSFRHVVAIGAANVQAAATQAACRIHDRFGDRLNHGNNNGRWTMNSKPRFVLPAKWRGSHRRAACRHDARGWRHTNIPNDGGRVARQLTVPCGLPEARALAASGVNYAAALTFRKRLVYRHARLQPVR